MALGWKFPVTSSTCTPPIWRRATSCCPTIPTRCARGSASACRMRVAPIGSTGWERIDKENDREGHRRRPLARSTEARPFSNTAKRTFGRRRLLLRKQLQGFVAVQPASVEHVLHWSNYTAKAIALIQAHGMPIDMRCGTWCRRTRPPSSASAASVRSESGHRQSDLHAGRPLELTPGSSSGSSASA